MNIKTYRKPNGDLNLDIDSVIKAYPEIAGAKCDDSEQKAISVALVPYIIEYIEQMYYKKADKDVYKDIFCTKLLILGNLILTVALMYFIIWRL